MPDFSATFSKFLKADDVKEGPRTLTIKAVAHEDVGPEERRTKELVMRFVEDDRGLVIKSTKYADATAIFGTKNTDGWIGKAIQLVYDPNIKFGGKRVGGIVLRAAVQ